MGVMLHIQSMPLFHPHPEQCSDLSPQGRGEVEPSAGGGIYLARRVIPTFVLIPNKIFIQNLKYANIPHVLKILRSKIMRWVLLVVFCLMVSPATAQEKVIGVYGAYIGPEDLYNSSGIRLRKAVDILRQDRANVHRFGIIHRDDQKDPWFFRKGARAEMPYLFRARGGIPKWARRAIVKGNIYVAVRVYAIDGVPTSLEVDIPG